jgi:hypothetical protein
MGVAEKDSVGKKACAMGERADVNGHVRAEAGRVGVGDVDRLGGVYRT